MLFILFWVPAATSLILGVVYLLFADARPEYKILGVIVFGTAAYLQFFSRHSLLGMLVQSALALYLVLWRRLDRC